MDTVPYFAPPELPVDWVKPNLADKQYTVGASLVCDFAFSRLIGAKCIEVLEEGTGRSSSPGQVRVELTETVGAYRKGEIMEINCLQAVPRSHVGSRGYYIRIKTNYHWVKTKHEHDDPDGGARRDSAEWVLPDLPLD